ncbi:chromosome segregation protein SMC [Thalassomonas actiniarum]|uniref:Chromosome partition protein Smc n=1 Tax=Thalassomonas actiniarum TaxID=485447 RepID=A0AAE9YVQ6_9GAMM|nr:chromosome segregation protein SMC [Thalassomonas actiniarum]WDE01219.1 chromosome segregation protein SMC [Thalassomonas actiniarum]
MRLKQIKLAGFKSFVDPTKVPFEQQMTAIVGPNGCGKSNIIDAVRWVLGESSAKNLRGDAMTDVIFNGAATRKPVGQASVELLFENTTGRLQGSMADRSEVSIKRSVNRDSINSYFLNGSKCRRKDITDIFLGTGLGPRSYAIIEQGTISRLIESKPQELRVFIEEAAGISKYKERRRDTENRIRHTRENLERLSDIRSELALQVDKLHQQAEAAKRFKTLKASERKYKAELAVLRWRAFDEKYKFNQQEITRRQGEVEDLVLKKNQQQAALFKAKQALTDDSDELVKLQQQKLQKSNDIARLEQNLKHSKQRQQLLLQELEKYRQQVEQASKEVSADEEKLARVSLMLDEKLPALALAQEQLAQLQQMAEQYQDEQQKWQQSWELYQQELNEHKRLQALLESKISAQLVLIERSQARQQALTDESGQLEQHQQGQVVDGQQQALTLAQASLDEGLYQQQELTEQISGLQQQITEHQQGLAKSQGLEQALVANLSQLEDRQAQQPEWGLEQTNWLKSQNIDYHGAFFEELTVEPDWEPAVEQVLSYWLEAGVVDNLPSVLPLETALLVTKHGNDVVGSSLESKLESKPKTLAEKVSGAGPFQPWLNQIYVAADLGAARLLLVSLAPGESVICPDGSWLGHGFLKKGTPGVSSDALQRKQNITALKAQLAALGDERSGHEQALQALTQTLKQAQQQDKDLTGQLKQVREQVQQLQQELLLTKQQVKHEQQRSALIQSELGQLSGQIKAEQGELERLQHEQAESSAGREDEARTRTLKAQQEQILQQLQTVQVKIRNCQQESHQQALEIEQGKSQKSHLQHNITRASEQLTRLKQQLEESKQQLALLTDPGEQDSSILQHQLEQMQTLEQALAVITEKQTGAQRSIAEIEQQQQANQKQQEKLKEQMAKYQLDGESYRLRAEASLEQLAEMQQSLPEVRASMPAEAKESVWQGHIIRLGKDINQLGAINLAAIEEYNSQMARKTFLDSQNDDLTQAITTLESAIEKIDKESRHKFKLTFDQVNQDLKGLFPKVFGGGSAYLALTGDDLLDTGVSIMARPPGKKNSTIHLLSGGEKALTALSLVFAIFRLNPAPFCMLDEVDAPLDDANVGRFCNLVREMSQTVQFIYISHNKIAMEMASHLTGVTMFEPGVSRMVAVDIDEAIAMAEVS